jgi:hypothetical protein
VTSKLNEDPCATIDGPWKGCPCISCVHTNDSSKGASRDNNVEHKGISTSYVVRCLVVVGLLAFKGLYYTGKEFSRDIRKVLELLQKSKQRLKIEKINTEFSLYWHKQFLWRTWLIVGHMPPRKGQS